MFPKKILHDNTDAIKNTSEKSIKKIGFTPMMISDFFEGMEVLAVQGAESREYIYGLYAMGKYCGYVYLGERWNNRELAKICSELMPPHLSLLSEYAKKNIEKVSLYGTLELCHYAWIYERVVEKIKK